MALATPSAGFLGSFLGLPVPGFSEFSGFFGFVRFLELSVLRCTVLHLIVLRCFASLLDHIVLHWIPLHYDALRCTAIALAALWSLFCTASH